MKYIFSFRYDKEFIDELNRRHELYGRDYECDGDSLLAKMTVEPL